MAINDIRANLSLENERNEHDRGAWVPRVSYSVGDRVQEGGLDYICVSGYHYSAATFAEDMIQHWVDREVLYAVSGSGGGSGGGNFPDNPLPANDGEPLVWDEATDAYVFGSSISGHSHANQVNALDPLPDVPTVDGDYGLAVVGGVPTGYTKTPVFVPYNQGAFSIRINTNLFPDQPIVLPTGFENATQIFLEFSVNPILFRALANILQFEINSRSTAIDGTETFSQQVWRNNWLVGDYASATQTAWWSFVTVIRRDPALLGQTLSFNFKEVSAPPRALDFNIDVRFKGFVL